MGFSSSQCRLLAMTSRKHAITTELMTLSSRKQAITREAKEASIAYNNSFNANILKWSPNGGATYTDITYNALMTPTAGVSGSSKPILITDNDGRVIVNDKYLEYAKMISPNGAPGGDWESNRLTILEEVTGISSDKILSNDNAAVAVEKASQATEDAHNAVLKLKGDEPVKYTNQADLIKRMPSNIYNAYNGSGTMHVTSEAEFKSIIDSIKNSLISWLAPEDNAAWQEACDQKYSDYASTISNEKLIKGASENPNSVISGEVNNAEVNLEQLITEVIANFKNNGGDYREAGTGNSKSTQIGLRDQSSDSSWSQWKTQMDAAVAVYEAAVAEESKAADEYNQTLDSTEVRNRINFYDSLFTAIAEQGWKYDDQVGEDNKYLNEMLQNNAYNLTMMTVNNDYKEGSSALSTKNKFDYTVGTADFNENIIKVSDPNVRYEALAVYENKKAEINEKESKIDLRMQKLQTELEAINAMIKGTEEVRDKNSETYFGIFA